MTINEVPITLFQCLISTIIIEVTVALIIKIKDKKDIINVILVNCLTNPIVTSLAVFINYYFGITQRNIAVGILEILVLITEWLIYKKYLNYKKINPFWVALILNSASYWIGELINLFR